MRADNVRPETINYVNRHGNPRLIPADKWKNGVTDGVGVLRSFERIVIHPSCKHTIAEFKLYSYRTDRLTGDVLPDIKPGNDHCIDALRYALQPIIKGRRKTRLIPLAEIGLSW